VRCAEKKSATAEAIARKERERESAEKQFEDYHCDAEAKQYADDKHLFVIF
jgi:hypothetical protein